MSTIAEADAALRKVAQETLDEFVEKGILAGFSGAGDADNRSFMAGSPSFDCV